MNTLVQGPSVMAWILGAKERVGLAEFPSDQYAPEDLSEKIIALSPAAKELLLLKLSLEKENEDKHEAAIKVSDEAHLAFDLDLTRYGGPAVEIVNDLLSLQIRFDAQESGIELGDNYLGSAFLSGERVVLVTSEDILRKSLLDMAAGLRETR